ncbi:MAG: hypothetical protein AB1297_09340 [bacterium]
MAASSQRKVTAKQTIFTIPGIVYIIGLALYLIKAEDNFNIKKWGDEYQQYIREVPAVNFIKGLWNIKKKRRRVIEKGGIQNGG